MTLKELKKVWHDKEIKISLTAWDPDPKIRKEGGFMTCVSGEPWSSNNFNDDLWWMNCEVFSVFTTEHRAYIDVIIKE